MFKKIKLIIIVLLLLISCTYFFTGSSLSSSKDSIALDDNEVEDFYSSNAYNGVQLPDAIAEETDMDVGENSEDDFTDKDDAENIEEREQAEPVITPIASLTVSEDKDNLWNEELVRQLSFLQSPIPGANISSRDTQLPGAPRAYRNGTHEGLDYYNGFCGVPIYFGDPVYAAGAGVVTRIDHGYSEPSVGEREKMLKLSAAEGDTPEDILDKLRGRQVWIVHAFGVVTRYAHLDTVSENLQVGDWIEAGNYVGTLGNSGTSNGARGTQNDAHLHFEIWVGDYYLGKGLPLDEIRSLWQQVLGVD